MTLWVNKATVLLSLLIASNTAWGLSEKAIIQRKSDRLHHARELLGKHYKKSVVRAGEKTVEVPQFVYEEVKERLKTKWKKKARPISKAIVHESQKYGFDPIFVMALIQHESVFDPDQLGSFGEIGLMQIKPSTAKWIAEKYNIEWKGDKSLRDPVQNIVYGTAYIDYLRERFESHSRLYLAAYNMGVTNVHRALEKQIWPKDYASKVMQNYIKFYSELRKNIKSTGHEHEITAKSQHMDNEAPKMCMPSDIVAKSDINPLNDFKKGGL